MKINSLNRVLLFLFIVLMYPSAILAEDIPLMKRGGVYTLPVEVNGVITLHFILDTGASDVNIAAEVALTLYRAGTIRDTDFLPGQTYTLADGSQVNSSRFLLRSLKIGNRQMTNVPASIGDISSPLLLGQSFLEGLGAWGIDSQKQVLTIGTIEKRTQREASTSLPAAPPETSPASPLARAVGNTGNNQIPAASVGTPNSQLGDTYIIEYLDPDNLKPSYSTERKVVSVGEGKITVTSKNIHSKTAKARTLQFTSEWNLISSRNPDGSGFDYSPPLKYFGFPLSPGKTWQQTSRETNMKTNAIRDHTLSATVGDWEEVSVPAETFRTIKITLQTALLDRSTGETSTGTDISWYAPNVRRSVKSETTSHNFQGQQERQVIQLRRYDVNEAPSPTQDSVAKASARADRQGPEAKTDSMPLIPLIPVLGHGQKASTFLTQMITLARHNGGVGQEAQLDALKQQIEALPKPTRGDHKAARLQNDQGLEAFKQGQYEQALQSFLTAYQLDASDVEVINNVGVAYLKTGNLHEAARYVGSALSLAPSRAAAWGNLAEVYAHDARQEEAVAAYALTYRFSKNKAATRRLLEAQTTNSYDPQVMQAATSALALSLISGRTAPGQAEGSVPLGATDGQASSQTNKREGVGPSQNTKEQEQPAGKHTMDVRMGVFDFFVIAVVITVAIAGCVIIISRWLRTSEGRTQHTRDHKETTRMQDGLEIDGMPGKGRLKVRECAGFCGYYVQPPETSCLNCGLIEPYRERPQERRMQEPSTSFSLLLGGLPLLSLFVGCVFVGFGSWISLVRIASLIYIALAAYYVWLQGKAARIDHMLQYLARKDAECLLKKEEGYIALVEAHHGEVRQLKKMIQDNISLEHTERNALALATIKEVLQVQCCKRLQCEALLWEIGKARLANKGLVVLFDQSSSSFPRREQYMQLLDEHLGKGYALVRQWQPEEDRRIQDVLTRLQASLTGCADVRGELLAQQAKILATGVTNFENSALHLAQISTEETKMFHTLGAASDTLFAGFGELEREYYRLLGEKEVIQELGTVH